MQSRTILVNLMAAFTLSIVSLSMGAAFGILSGRGALAGMFSAAVLAFVASTFGGTKIQCSGPTAPLTTLVVGLIASQSDLSFTGLSTDQFLNLTFLFSGILLFITGALGLARYISLIPNVIISGFMTGIGLLILKSQFQELASFAQSDNFLLKIAWVLLTLAIMVGTPYLLKKWMPRWAGLLSGTFLALLIGTILAEVLALPLSRISLGGSTESLLQTLAWFSPNEVLSITKIGVILAGWWGVQICLTMYLDTLMTSMIMDRLTGKSTNRRKELLAQGSAGMLIGMIGGIPGAQATVRSVLIFKEGATYRWAGALAGIFCLVFLLAFQDWLNLIPSAIFIGILIKIAFDIMDFQPLRLYAKELRRDCVWRDFFSRHDDQKIYVTNREIIFILATAGLTLFWGLIPAVLTFTVLYWFLNKLIWSQNPMRDLEPQTETQSIAGEN